MSADVARDANLAITPTSTELRNASNTVMCLVGEARVVLCNDKHSAVSTVLFFDTAPSFEAWETHRYLKN